MTSIYYVKHLISLDKIQSSEPNASTLPSPQFRGLFFCPLQGEISFQNSYATVAACLIHPKIFWETFSDPSPIANMTFSRRSRHFFCRSNWSASCNNAAAEIFDMAAWLKLLKTVNKNTQKPAHNVIFLGKIFRTFFLFTVLIPKRSPTQPGCLIYLFRRVVFYFKRPV